jgi:two-component system response regulator AtoC
VANKLKVLVVDDEENLRHWLKLILTDAGYETDEAASGEEAFKKFENNIYDFVLCDIRMPKMDGPSMLHEMRRRQIPATVIMMSAYGSEETAVEAMKLGAYDYISKPFRQDEILLVLRKAEERERLVRENRILRRQVVNDYGFQNIVTRNPRMQEILQTVLKIADYKTTVLISGESGTGKELIARAIHYSSSRKDGPFVAVNCGAIPENLLESELFGHVKGAFTDASYTKKGLFEEADEGTILLDEIGELPPLLQVKLLRVLQEEEVRRVGDTRPVPINVRVIAATVHDLADEVKNNRFRADLFYRINVLSIALPPLRERKEDIPLLVNHFIEKFAPRFNKHIKGLSKEAAEMVMDNDWSGNIRELENAMERAIALAEGEIIQVNDLPPYLREKYGTSSPGIFIPQQELSIKKISQKMEKQLIQRALEKTNGNRTQAAKLLEISHRALIYKIKEYGLDKTLPGRLKSYQEDELEPAAQNLQEDTKPDLETTPNPGELK